MLYPGTCDDGLEIAHLSTSWSQERLNKKRPDGQEKTRYLAPTKPCTAPPQSYHHVERKALWAAVYHLVSLVKKRTRNCLWCTSYVRTLEKNSTSKKYLYSNGSQFSSGEPMMDRVATGSTAEISAPNRSGSIGLDVSMRANPCIEKGTS